ncbi:hypothetical protein [Streptomyces diastatochromogenes]|uniref:hypothetical protein n=1 Tax=Streptomyces diastatochromogenes TaxID=42236 RepID=UPI00367F320D
MSTADDTRVKELADLFVRFLETNTAPEGLFAPSTPHPPDSCWSSRSGGSEVTLPRP